MSVALCTVLIEDRLILSETGRAMTALGASIYLGFFILAALWLFLTSEGPLSRVTDDQGQRPDRSNSAKTVAGSDGSSPWRVSHSSQK